MDQTTILLTAEILEKAAAYIEAVESEKAAAATAAQAKTAADLRQKIEAVTGEQPTDEVLNKLAASEPALLALVEKLAGNLKAPDALGGPAETESDVPRSKTASVQAAEDQFVSWLSN